MTSENEQLVKETSKEVTCRGIAFILFRSGICILVFCVHDCESISSDLRLPFLPMDGVREYLNPIWKSYRVELHRIRYSLCNQSDTIDFTLCNG